MHYLINTIGFIGVAFVVSAFSLLQVGILNLSHIKYHLLNFLGGLCIFISLMFNWNLPSVVMECIWMVFSVIGMIRNLPVKNI